jgi:hypothetical protein
MMGKSRETIAWQGEDLSLLATVRHAEWGGAFSCRKCHLN